MKMSLPRIVVKCLVCVLAINSHVSVCTTYEGLRAFMERLWTCVVYRTNARCMSVSESSL